MPNTQVGTAYVSIYPQMAPSSKAIVSKGIANATAGQGAAMTAALTIGNIVSQAAVKGVSEITSSLGGAISRVDTMRNYPKVMEAMGVSTGEASASVQTMSDRLAGLPTRLDSMTTGVQSIYSACSSMGVSLTDATAAGLGLNDMLLAGGQGTQVAESAMTQFTQALSKGKPDMEDWKSIVMAAPAQMNQLAQSMLGPTANSNDLYEALKNDQVSMQDVLDAIIDLDQNGGAGFASFSQQAQDATGGIQTAIDNAKNAVTKGVSSVIEAIGVENIVGVIDDAKERIKAAFQAITEAVDGFKETFDMTAAKEAFDSFVASFVPDGGSAADVGRTLGEVVNGLVAALKLVAPVAGPTVAALLAFKGVATIAGPIAQAASGVRSFVGALSSIRTVLGMVSGLKDIPAAFSLIASTIAGGPVALIVAGIAALVAGLLYLYATNEDFRNGVNAIWEGIKSFFQGVVDFFAAIPGTLAAVPEAILSGVQGLGEQVAGFFQGVLDGAAGFFQTVTDALASNPVGQALLGVVDGVKQVFQGLWDAIRGGFEAFFGIFVGIFTGDWTQFQDGVSTLLGGLSEVFSGAWNAIASAIELVVRGVYTVVTTVFSAIRDFVVSIPERIQEGWAAITGFFSGLWQGVKDTVTGVWDALTTFIQGVPGKIKGFFESLPQNLADLFGKARDWIKDKFNEVVDFVRDIPGKIVGFFQEIPGKIADVFSNIHVPTFHVEGGFNLDPANFSLPHISFYAGGGLVGGPYTGPQLGVVGEAGPEVISPVPTLRAVIGDELRDALDGARGGVVVNVTVNAEVADDVDAYALGQRIGSGVAARLKQRGCALA